MNFRNIKSLVLIIILTVCLTSSCSTQNIPQGIWKTSDEKVIVDFQAKTIVIDGHFMMSEEESKQRRLNLTLIGKDIHEVDTSKVRTLSILEVIKEEEDTRKGVIYMKTQANIINPFSVLIFYQIKPDILLLNLIQDFETLEEAKEAIAEQKRLFQNVQENPERYEDDIFSTLISEDMYGFMALIFRKEDDLIKLKAMPTIQLNDKESLLKLLLGIEDKLKSYEDRKDAQGMMNNLGRLLMEDIFIQMGYNPYTSSVRMFEGIQEYQEDKEIKKLMQKIDELLSEKVSW